MNIYITAPYSKLWLDHSKKLSELLTKKVWNKKKILM